MYGTVNRAVQTSDSSASIFHTFSGVPMVGMSEQNLQPIVVRLGSERRLSQSPCMTEVPEVAAHLKRAATATGPITALMKLILEYLT